MNEILTQCFQLLKNDFYDFDAKYVRNDTEYSQSELSEEELMTVKNFAWHAFSSLGCSGWGRVDLIQDNILFRLKSPNALFSFG